MIFENALSQMKTGLRMRRSLWPIDIWVEIIKSNDVYPSPYFLERNVTATHQIKWHAQTCDILADDWIVMDMDEEE